MNSQELTRLYGVMGHPIGHTLSPMIHRILAEETGKNAVYLPFDVSPNQLHEAVAGMRALGVGGMNITLPHKTEMIYEADILTDEARQMQAVNAVKWENGTLIGTNTDGAGFLAALHRNRVPILGKRVALFGAGGAAEAVGMALAAKNAAKIFVLNRTPVKAELLCRKINQAYGEIAFTAKDFELAGIDLAINATSLGMMPNTERSVVEQFSFMKNDGFAVDIVYAPRETKFLRTARQEGIRTVSGIGMLIEQAVRSFEFFHDVTVPEETVQKLYDLLSFDKNIILTGFMGVGKTTVGKYLAERYSLEFVDTDRVVEEWEHQSVRDIFEEKGELYFRAVEHYVLEEVLQKKGAVIALGGGAAVNPDNRQIISDGGVLIPLSATLDTIFSRLGHGAERPLIQGKTKEEIAELYHEREPAYASFGPGVHVDGKSISEISEEIIKRYINS